MMDIEEFRRKHWGLERVLFSTSPPERRYLDKVFTGRAEELETTRVAIREAPRRVLVSGTFGIGKTVFIHELLARLGQHYKAEVLTVYDSVNIGPSDLPTAILRALARMLKDEDEEARNVDAALSGLEVTTERERELGAGAEIAGIGGRGTLTDTTTRAFKSVTNAAYHIQRLIENATQRKPDRRLIVAVDDLDKRDPETIRQALLESRSILHLECSYPELIAKLNEAVRSDWVVNVQDRYYPQPLTMPLVIPPQTAPALPEPPVEAGNEGEPSKRQKRRSRRRKSS